MSTYSQLASMTMVAHHRDLFLDLRAAVAYSIDSAVCVSLQNRIPSAALHCHKTLSEILEATLQVAVDPTARAADTSQYLLPRCTGITNSVAVVPLTDSNTVAVVLRQRRCGSSNSSSASGVCCSL